MGFVSKRSLAPPTILLGLPFARGCGVSPQSPSSGVQPLLQCHVASTQVPTVFLGLFCPWTKILQAAQQGQNEQEKNLEP